MYTKIYCIDYKLYIYICPIILSGHLPGFIYLLSFEPLFFLNYVCSPPVFFYLLKNRVIYTIQCTLPSVFCGFYSLCGPRFSDLCRFFFFVPPFLVSTFAFHRGMIENSEEKQTSHDVYIYIYIYISYLNLQYSDPKYFWSWQKRWRKELNNTVRKK